ncbi:unnamed protein product [Musa acuminata subsp. burmannicoides]
MDPVDLVPSGYRFVPTAEELVVDYLANWIAGTPPGRAVAFADVYGTEPWNLLGSDRQEGYFCGAPAQGQRLLARRSNGRHRFLASEQKAENPSSPSSTGARSWWEEGATFPSRTAGGRTPGG